MRYVFSVHKMFTYPLTCNKNLVNQVQVDVYIFMKYSDLAVSLPLIKLIL